MHSHINEIRDGLLNQGLKELSAWCMFKDVNVKNYSGIRLTTTSLSTADKCATSVKPEVKWESVDIKFYELHKVDSEKVMHNMLPRNFKYINRCL